MAVRKTDATLRKTRHQAQRMSKQKGKNRHVSKNTVTKQRLVYGHEINFGSQKMFQRKNKDGSRTIRSKVRGVKK